MAIDELILRELEGEAPTETNTEEVAVTTEASGVSEEMVKPAEQDVEAASTEDKKVLKAEETEGVEENKVLDKHKIDYHQFLSEHEDTFSKYFKEKNTDYTKLSADQLAEMKFKKDNPTLSDEDIKEELSDKYGIGLERKSENADDYDSDEDLKEAKDFNKNLTKAQRELKKDAPKFAQEFEESKAVISLPDLEIDLPNVEVNPEEFVREYIEQSTTKAKDHTEKVWQPLVEKEVSELSEIILEIAVENGDNKEVIPVKYSLSESDKQAFKEKMNGYIADDYDNRTYVNEKGEADLKKFFSAKAKEMYVDKIIAVAVREATTKLKSDIYKKEFVNYTDEVRDVAPTGQPDDVENFILNRQRN